jgi:hypothetical protein
MTRESTTTNNKLAWRKALAAILIVAGIGVIATSFVWPGKSSQRGAWSTEQAKQYQAAAGRLHSLSHQMANAKPGRDVTVRKDFEVAKVEYDALRGDLDAALSRPRRWAWTMRVCGMLAVFVGGVLLFTLPKDR